MWSRQKYRWSSISIDTYTLMHAYLIFLREINVVTKIRKNDWNNLQMDNQLGPEDCREHVLCWYSIWFRGFSWGNWYFIHAFLEIICSNLLDFLKFYLKFSYISFWTLQADAMAVCSYFCFFFMMAYKFRQCRAVVNRFVSCITYSMFAKTVVKAAVKMLGI